MIAAPTGADSGFQQTRRSRNSSPMRMLPLLALLAAACGPSGDEPPADAAVSPTPNDAAVAAPDGASGPAEALAVPELLSARPIARSP